MTLDEAITHAREIAQRGGECAKDHEQLAEWLEELRKLKTITATLGRGTCEYVIEDNMNETEGMGDVWFRCTNCGTSYDYYADEWLLKMPYCPRCGCEVDR